MKKIQYFSWLRAAGCLAVVVLHTFYAAMGLYGETSKSYMVAMAVRNCMMWAVPCFVMVSGALLLSPNRNVTYKKLFGTYILKMVAVLIIITAVYELVDCLLGQEVWGLSLIKDYFSNLLSDTSWKNLWYLYLMIALYLMLPIMRLAIRNAKSADIRYMIVLFFVFLSIMPTLEKTADIQLGFYITEHTVYPLLFVVGFAMHEGYMKIPLRASIMITVIGFIALVSMSVFEVCYSGGSDGTSIAYSICEALTSSYASPVIVVLSLGIFSLFKHGNALMSSAWSTTDAKLSAITVDPLASVVRCDGSSIVHAIDSVTLEVYLIHMIVLKIIMVKISEKNMQVGIGLVFLIAVVVGAVSILLALFLKRCMKIVKRRN